MDIRTIKRLMKLPKRKRLAAMCRLDWTICPKDGRTNTSPEFDRLSGEVAQLIRNSANDIVRGRTEAVGRFIMAQLAHVHGVGPLKRRGRSRKASAR